MVFSNVVISEHGNTPLLFTFSEPLIISLHHGAKSITISLSVLLHQFEEYWNPVAS